MARFRLFDSHPMSFPQRQTYRAICDRVVDGDTIDVLLDLGVSVYAHVRIRIAGLNAPERRGATRSAGERATQALAERIEGRPVRVTLERDRRSFDRYLGAVDYWTGAEWRDVREL